MIVSLKAQDSRVVGLATHRSDQTRWGVCMSTNKSNAPVGDAQKTAEELERIAKHLATLNERVEALEQENRLLHQRQESLVAERATLVERNEEARSRVEAMIERLKALELAGLSS